MGVEMYESGDVEPDDLSVSMCAHISHTDRARSDSKTTSRASNFNASMIFLFRLLWRAYMMALTVEE